jgi:hypothetical protein
MFMSHHKNTGQNHNKKTANKSLKKSGKVQIFENDVTNQNYIQEEIKSRFISGNAYNHPVHNLLSSHLLLKTKTRIYKTVCTTLTQSNITIYYKICNNRIIAETCTVDI